MESLYPLHLRLLQHQGQNYNVHGYARVRTSLIIFGGGGSMLGEVPARDLRLRPTALVASSLEKCELRGWRTRGVDIPNRHIFKIKILSAQNVGRARIIRVKIILSPGAHFEIGHLPPFEQTCV